MVGWTDKWMDGWMNGWMGALGVVGYLIVFISLISIHVYSSKVVFNLLQVPGHG